MYSNRLCNRRQASEEENRKNEDRGQSGFGLSPSGSVVLRKKMERRKDRRVGEKKIWKGMEQKGKASI